MQSYDETCLLLFTTTSQNFGAKNRKQPLKWLSEPSKKKEFIDRITFLVAPALKFNFEQQFEVELFKLLMFFRNCTKLAIEINKKFTSNGDLTCNLRTVAPLVFTFSCLDNWHCL